MIQSHSNIRWLHAPRSCRQYTCWLLAFALLAALPTLAPAAKSSDRELTAQRTVYSQALKALRKGQTKRFHRLRKQLGDYPLVSYLDYRYLVVRRGGSHDKQIAKFIVEHKDSHLSRRLHNAWLRSLFKRRHYTKLINSYQEYGDVSLQCLYVRSHIRLKRSTKELEPLIHSIWLHGKSRPKICDPLLKWFRNNGMTKDLVWQRIQLSMEKRNTRLARYLKRFLPKKERAWVDLWIRVHRNPKRYLRDRRLKSDSPHASRIVAHGITRRARKNPEAAYEWYEGFRRAKVLTLKQVQDLRYRIALEAASDGLPLAHSLMDATRPYLRDDKFRHMRLRLALHERDWQRILEAAKELPDAYPYNQMGSYWQARALKQLGRTAESIELFQEVALHRSYYGFLAAERLNRPHSLNNAPVQLKDDPVKRLPALDRAREFYHHGSIMNAREEWYDLVTQGDEEQLNHAAVAANSWGWHEGTIRAFGKSRYFDDLKRRFPRAHADLFEKEAHRTGVDPSLLFAISRRESAFAADTRSRAGAVGLMQLMPGTARQVARSLKLKRPRTQSLKRPSLNIRLGSRYIADMLKRYGGNPAMALAAYNAGPGAVDRWRPKFETDADIWIDTIPFEETRQYVRIVLEYAAIYQWRAGRPTSPIWPQIQPIRP